MIDGIFGEIDGDKREDVAEKHGPEESHLFVEAETDSDVAWCGSERGG